MSIDMVLSHSHFCDKIEIKRDGLAHSPLRMEIPLLSWGLKFPGTDSLIL